MKKFIIAEESLNLLKELKNSKRWSINKISMQLGISVNTWIKVCNREAVSEMVAYRVNAVVDLIKEGKLQ